MAEFEEIKTQTNLSENNPMGVAEDADFSKPLVSPVVPVPETNAYAEVEKQSEVPNIDIPKAKRTFAIFAAVFFTCLIVVSAVFLFFFFRKPTTQQVPKAALDAAQQVLLVSAPLEVVANGMTKQAVWNFGNIQSQKFVALDDPNFTPQALSSFVLTGAQNVVVENLQYDNGKIGVMVTYKLSQGFDVSRLTLTKIAQSLKLGSQIWSPSPLGGGKPTYSRVSFIEAKGSQSKIHAYIFEDINKNYLVIRVESQGL